MASVRIGIIGAGDNTRKRHIPGLRALTEVSVASVCNRRPESTAAIAREYGIPRTHARWQDVVADPQIDAVVIGTWPYLHCPVTLTALAAGKHVLTEARMCLNAAEAHMMRDTARLHANLIAQIVPSPFGLTGDAHVRDLIEADYLGELREYYVYGFSGALADPEAALSWRQDEVLSGINVLTLGIVHETVLRWLPQPERVLAQTCAFIPSRIDPESGLRRSVGTPDSVQVLTQLPGGARGVYQFSGVTPCGQGMGVKLYGSKGALFYDLSADRLYGTRGPGAFEEIAIPVDKARGWQVEADFVASIRERLPVRLTNFETGVSYMEFTEAAALSAVTGQPVALPLTPD